MSQQLITSNHAAGAAATLAGRANRMARGFGSGVYPITPQTECIEYLCNQEIEKGSVVRVESEHSAMAVCMGFAYGGARTFTASSSNGLAYMAENVFAAGFSRLPIVMMAVNRTLGPPWNIWADHGDTLMLRDSGWIQLYCEDNQEVLDTVLAAFRLSEDAGVLLPSMVCQDAFILSHSLMNTEVPEQAQVDAFLPPLVMPHQLDSRPKTVGGLDYPREAESHRLQAQQAMDRVPAVYAEVRRSFHEVFGRSLPDVVVPYRMDDAEVVLVSMGTMATTVRAVVDEARGRGLKVGALRIRMFRPFPVQEVTAAFAGRARIGIIDRNLSPGHGGVVWGEARALAPHGALVQNYISGIGGGDVRPFHIQRILDDLLDRKEAAAPMIMEVGA
jgi:pyruvate/2-oxoacid:ferredoxin oxidoreductase alpha subunit